MKQIYVLVTKRSFGVSENVGNAVVLARESVVGVAPVENFSRVKNTANGQFVAQKDFSYPDGVDENGKPKMNEVKKGDALDTSKSKALKEYYNEGNNRQNFSAKMGTTSSVSKFLFDESKHKLTKPERSVDNFYNNKNKSDVDDVDTDKRGQDGIHNNNDKNPKNNIGHSNSPSVHARMTNSSTNVPETKSLSKKRIRGVENTP